MARSERANWSGGIAAAAITLALGIALLLLAPRSLRDFLLVAGGAYLVAAAVEALVAAAQTDPLDRKAALLLGAGGGASGAILLVAASAPLQRLNLLLLFAILVRAGSAAAVAVLLGPRGRAWILCRSLGEAGLAMLLVVTLFAVLAALPFASLSTGFQKAQASVSADLGMLIAASLIAAAASQLLVALCSGPATASADGNGTHRG